MRSPFVGTHQQGYQLDHLAWAMLFTFYSSFLELPLIISSFMLLFSTLPAFSLAELHSQELYTWESGCSVGVHLRVCTAQETSLARSVSVWTTIQRLLILTVMCFIVNLAGQTLLNSRKIILQTHTSKIREDITVSSSVMAEPRSLKDATCNADGTHKSWKKTVLCAANGFSSRSAVQLLFEPVNMGTFLFSVELAIVQTLLQLRAMHYALPVLAAPVIIFDIVL
jgi:hypothetical protein